MRGELSRIALFGCSITLIAIGLYSTFPVNPNSDSGQDVTLTPQAYLPIVAKSPPIPNLFLDMNGSGLYEDGEPGLAGFTVCVRGTTYCTTTDTYGRFSLPANLGSPITVLITDPNASVPSLAMRYINKWHRTVVIPSFEMNGVTVPEQHLSDTEVIPIEEGVEIVNQGNIQIALMQGFITLPFRHEDIDKISWISHYDRDPRTGFVMNYKGDTTPWSDDDPGAGTWDNHNGTDFGVPIGTLTLASMPGILADEFVNPENGARVARLENRDLLNNRPGYFPVLVYAHHSVPLVSIGQRVYRGQIILLSGVTGHHLPHLHLTYAGNSLPGFPEDFRAFDPYGAEFFTEDPLELISDWTVYNNPHYP